MKSIKQVAFFITIISVLIGFHIMFNDLLIEEFGSIRSWI